MSCTYTSIGDNLSVQEVRDGDQQAVVAHKDEVIRPAVGVLVADSTNRRLVEAASIQLGLEPVALREEEFRLSSLQKFELIVADEAIAGRIRSCLAELGEQGEAPNPAVIAVVTSAGQAVSGIEKTSPQFDGVLTLPEEPVATVTQLGLTLYAHRAFARKYESAMDELRLSRRIFRSVTSGISISNALQPDLPLVYVNPAFEAMTGYSLEEVVGRNCRFLQRGDRDQPGVTLIREALRTRREVIAVLKNYRKDGTSFWNELALSPIFNRDGELTHFVGIQMDVTARVEFEAALRQSEKLAAVGRLAASIAHEINNPLESVTNLLYLARKVEDEAVRSEYLELADKELRRVAQITSQSLRFYKQSTKAQAILCSDLLASVLDVYESRASNMSVAIEVRERMTQSIVCLESEIRQVLSNLVRNALDAMRGPGRLLIRSTEATEWRSHQHGVMITVADTGSGMDAETMQRLYTAFFTTKGIGGTGLGLWVSAEIVNRHRGRLRVKSCQTPGRSGTVFELFLPYQGVVE